MVYLNNQYKAMLGQLGNNQADDLPKFAYATNLKSLKILVEEWEVPTSYS